MIKTALVSGASSGLGKEITILLLQNGWQVVGLARKMKDIEISSTNNLIKINCDISDSQSVLNAFGNLDELGINVDLLVNCAGRGLREPLVTTRIADINEVLAVNLYGNILVAWQTYLRMLPRKTGQIINIISTSGMRFRTDEAIYCASKWGMRGFTESLRQEAAKHGIKIAGVYPGGMNSSNFWQREPNLDTSDFMSPQQVVEQIMQVIGQPDGMNISELVIDRW